MNESNQKNSGKVLLAIIIIVIAVIVGIGIWQSTEKEYNTPTETTQLSETQTQTTTETTLPTTTETTTQLTLGKVANIQTNVYSVWAEEGGGFGGVTISFDPVDNADGYRLKYIFDYGQYTENFEDIGATQTKLCFGTQEGPSKIEICPYSSKNDEMLYGQWTTIYDTSSYDYNNLANIQGQEWENMTSGYVEIDPYYSINN